MTTIPDPYGRTYFRGVLQDNATIAALKVAEGELGYELTLYQGIGGAAASKGAHLDGRMTDGATFEAERKLRVFKDIGFIGWLREDLPGVWDEHWHIGLIFDGRDNRKGISDLGFRQIGMWDRGLDGLTTGLPDRGINAYRPTPQRGFSMDDYEATFVKPPPKPIVNRVTRARDALVVAIHQTGQAASLLHDTKGRPKAKAEVERLWAQRRELKAMLERMPKQ